MKKLIRKPTSFGGVTEGRRLGNIELLRFAAAALVVFYHLHIRFAERVGLLPELNEAMGMFGASGVDIFFVISGFVIALNVSNPATTASRFIRARIARIVPTYWLLTAVVAGLMLVSPSLFNTQYSLSRLVQSLFFVTDRFSNDLPLIGVGWSLNYEVFFYLLVFVVLLFGLRPRMSLLVQAVVLMALVGSGTFNSIFIEFLFGYIVYVAWMKIRHNFWLGVVATALGVLILANWKTVSGLGVDRWVYFGLAGMLLLLGVVLLPQIQGSWVRKLGFASYSIYLTQWLSIPVVGLVALRLTAVLDAAPLYFGIGLVSVIVVGIFYSEIIDVRLYSWTRRFFRLTK